MYTYEAYNLGIHSDLPLPQLLAVAEANPDVVIKIGKINSFSQQPNEQKTFYRLTAQEAYLFWDVVGGFLVRQGREIIIDPLSDVEEQLVRLPLLGAVLAVLLYQRKFLVLHSSAVEVNGSAIAFVGNSGWGKSTMAATMYARGHKTLADDVVAIDISDPKNPTVVPGFPQIKLWPEAVVASLGENPETLPQINSQVEKRARHTRDRFAQTALPLKRVYVLGQSATPTLRRLPLQEGLLKTISSSYLAMGEFGQQFLQGAEASLHLHQCTNLAQNVPIYSLERPSSLELLPALAQLVEEDLANEVSLVNG
ncbi:Hpr(Ser) kinase/phosphatase [Crinalium epipsammum PCC 9333]|uniref:Hpr(Ser) kinase/phosphatase n=1 Tax=Crinalium epipsammum PCC 9333 TaxID=1173022 RepID=K9W5R4_9CYAN|nr:Hpr(Ser) kinase/phosphatase [Crinalium epipsammum]AFZ15082.1 Hpr(Ser) kinase/phosphatase [Crinalium epipsammum PCC 9333]